MKPLRFTIRAEGTSDIMLVPIVRWALAQELPDTPLTEQFAELLPVPSRSRKKLLLADKLRKALQQFPCDLLFVHRDADGETRRKRVDEIEEAVSALAAEGVQVPHVCLVPVRESEAWVLFDEGAIRTAAGHPDGTTPLRLPSLKAVESVANPKEVLNAALKTASERTGRRLTKFDTRGLAAEVAENITDYSPLRRLVAFREFEKDLKSFTRAWVAEE